MLLVVSVFATLSNDAGIPDALVQRKEITAAHEATAWWLSMLTALGATVVLYRDGALDRSGDGHARADRRRAAPMPSDSARRHDRGPERAFAPQA